ncbi:hypothetical protein [Singapore grouper iridovirus]|nr:hypothetical protein [Singapore grouper iridovirus]
MWYAANKYGISKYGDRREFLDNLDETLGPSGDIFTALKQLLSLMGNNLLAEEVMELGRRQGIPSSSVVKSLEQQQHRGGDSEEIIFLKTQLEEIQKDHEQLFADNRRMKKEMSELQDANESLRKEMREVRAEMERFKSETMRQINAVPGSFCTMPSRESPVSSSRAGRVLTKNRAGITEMLNELTNSEFEDLKRILHRSPKLESMGFRMLKGRYLDENRLNVADLLFSGNMERAADMVELAYAQLKNY